MTTFNILKLEKLEGKARKSWHKVSEVGASSEDEALEEYLRGFGAKAHHNMCIENVFILDDGKACLRLDSEEVFQYKAEPATKLEV